MNIKEFDKPTLRAFRVELEALLKKYDGNVEMSVGNITFSPGDAKITINAKIPGVKSQTEELIESYAKIHGLVLQKNGRRLVEYHPRKYKMPFIYVDTDGKRYQTSLDRAKQLFAA